MEETIIRKRKIKSLSDGECIKYWEWIVWDQNSPISKVPLDSPVLLCITKYSDIETKINKMPNAVGYIADLFHPIQHRLTQLHLNCNCADCNIVWIVSLVDWSIVIRLQNRYKTFSLTRTKRNLGPATLLYNGFEQSFSDSLNNSISLNFIVPFMNNQLWISPFCCSYCP